MAQQTDLGGFRAWLSWSLVACFYLYEFFLQASPSVMEHEMMHTFHITAAQLGNWASYCIYAYAVMQIPVGLLLARYSNRLLLGLAVFSCAAGSLLFSQAQTFAMASVGRFMIGFGAAFAVVGCMNIAAVWHKPKHFSMLTGILLTMGMLGAAGGNAVLSRILDALGWRHTMLIMGFIGIGLAIIIYMVVQDKALPKGTEEASLLASLGPVMRNKQIWLIALFGGLLFAPTLTFGELWGVPFLMEKYGITKHKAGDIVSLLFFGWAAGAVFMGWLGGRMGRAKPILWFSALSLFVMQSLALYTHPGVLMTSILFLGIGLASSGMLMIFPLGRANIAPAFVATALGVINTLNTAGGAFAQPMIGKILDDNWSGKLVDGVRYFSLENYVHGLSLLTIMIILAIVFLYPLEDKPTS